MKNYCGRCIGLCGNVALFIKEKYKNVYTQAIVYRSALVLLVKKKTNIEPKFSNKKT
jgi:formate hydrogenlyase subunit 6/NADH:ubiquinone oxidoreductase subunit I